MILQRLAAVFACCFFYACLLSLSEAQEVRGICVLQGDAAGTIFFDQGEKGCHIYGTISGLSPGKHGFHVHEFGDLSLGCTSTAGHYNPLNVIHGAPTDPDDKRHYGDLGNVVADDQGRAAVDIHDRLVSLVDPLSVFGRAVVVHKLEDDLGRGGFPDSKTTGHAGARLACCVIGRRK